MLKFNEFLKENDDQLAESYIQLVEKLIVLGGKPYPKFGNVVIMAGGAGSGKGFIKDKLLGIEGKVFDVDEFKTMALKSKKIRDKAQKEYGVDLSQMDLKNPSDVVKLHKVIGDEMNLPKKDKSVFFANVLTSPKDRKPNIIFDVTLKDLVKLQNITHSILEAGYDIKNIHIVWIINDLEVAKVQNTKRERSVPVEILVNTHRGVSQTMRDIVDMGESLSKYMDGDIVFVFNKVGVDTAIQKGTGGGMVVTDADYFFVKKSGSPVKPIDDINKEVREKITAYVPKNVDWMN